MSNVQEDIAVTQKNTQFYFPAVMTSPKDQHASHKGSPSSLSREDKRKHKKQRLVQMPIPTPRVWSAQDAVKSPPSLASTKSSFVCWLLHLQEDKWGLQKEAGGTKSTPNQDE